MSKESIDWKAVLADLEEKKTGIEQMIKYTKQMLGMPTNGASSASGGDTPKETNKPVGYTQAPQGKTPMCKIGVLKLRSQRSYMGKNRIRYVVPRGGGVKIRIPKGYRIVSIRFLEDGSSEVILGP